MSSQAVANQTVHAVSGYTGWRTAAWCLAVGVTAAAVVVIAFSPRFVLWRGLTVPEPPIQSADFSRAISSLAQLNDPWASVENEVHKVIRWRLLFPLVWHYLQLPRWLYLAMPQVGCLLACWLVAWLMYRSLGNWSQSWMATALFATLPWFFVSSGWLSYFDSWLVIGLLAAAFVQSRCVLGLSCFLTPWIDERFVLALPVTLMVRAVALRRIEEKQWRAMLLDVAVVLATSLPYTTVRAVAWLEGDADSTAYVQSHWEQIRGVRFTRYLKGLWSGFRAGWLIIGAALCFAGRRLGWQWGSALVFVVIGSAAGCLFVAADMSRSLMIASPVLLLGVMVWKECRPSSFRWALPILTVANLLLPASHVIWSFTVPISSLPTEIHRWRNPPPFLAATDSIRRGKALLEQGKFREARECFDAAIRLDDKIAKFYLERAAANIRLADASGAAADVEAALRLEPESADALFLRAYLRAAKGETSSAADDLRHAPSTHRLIGRRARKPNGYSNLSRTGQARSNEPSPLMFRAC